MKSACLPDAGRRGSSEGRALPSGAAAGQCPSAYTAQTKHNDMAHTQSGSKKGPIALVVAASQLLLLLLLLALSRQASMTPYWSNADIMMRSYWHDADVTHSAIATAGTSGKTQPSG